MVKVTHLDISERKLKNRRVFDGIRLTTVLVFFLLTLPVTILHAESSRLKLPPSRLGPDFDSPIYLTGNFALGKSVEYGNGLNGYGGSLLFRPGAADRFLSFLYDWDLALVLQVDYQKIGVRRRILSGDLIFRNYLKNMEQIDVHKSLYWGIGVGGSELTVHAGEATGSPQYFSGLIEGGHEWKWKEKYIAFAKLQFRYYNHGGINYSVWTVQAGVGMPLP